LAEDEGVGEAVGRSLHLPEREPIVVGCAAAMAMVVEMW
jgi:hypothetical protein